MTTNQMGNWIQRRRKTPEKEKMQLRLLLGAPQEGGHCEWLTWEASLWVGASQTSYPGSSQQIAMQLLTVCFVTTHLLVTQGREGGEALAPILFLFFQAPKSIRHPSIHSISHQSSFCAPVVWMWSTCLAFRRYTRVVLHFKRFLRATELIQYSICVCGCGFVFTHVILDLGGMDSSPTLGVELT